MKTKTISWRQDGVDYTYDSMIPVFGDSRWGLTISVGTHRIPAAILWKPPYRRQRLSAHACQ